MELKDLLKTLDLEDAKDIESFKEKFRSKFISRNEAINDDEVKSHLTGKITGALKTLAKRTFGLTNQEIDGKQWEDIIELGAAKKEATIEELKKQSSQTSEETLKELQSKLEKANKANIELKENNDLLTTTYNNDKSGWEGKFKEFKIKNHLETAKSKLSNKMLSELSQVQRLGFDASLKDNLIIDMDDKEEIVVKNREGKRIPNPAKVGTYLNLEEALELEADKLGLIKKNNGNNTNQQLFQSQSTNNNNNNNNGQSQQAQAGTQRRIHPNALKNAEVLRAQSNQDQ